MSTEIIFVIIVVLIASNGLLIDYFDRLTMYKGVELHFYSGWLVLLCICFCVLMFPFFPLIREYRKDVYIKNRVMVYEYYYMGGCKKQRTINNMGTVRDSDYETYVNYKRYLMVKELQKKSKKKKIWNL